MTFPIYPTAWQAQRLALMLGLAATLLLAACGSTPKVDGKPPRASQPAPSTESDGPEAEPPPDLHQVPDAEPKVEALRIGGPNKPYAVAGTQYTPMTRDEPAVERGLASWYGRKFHGRRTASGEIYNMYAMTGAHRTFPIPSYARVRNPANGREVIVRINDRGPFKRDRVVDVSYTAALKLGILSGVSTVEVERITHEAIRNGSWRREVSTGQRATLTLAQALQAGEPVAAPASPQDTSASATRPAPTASTQAREPEWGDRLDAPQATVAVESPRADGPHVAPAPPSKATSKATPATAPVTSILPVERAGTQAARGWWLQLGAFKASEGAAQFQRQVASDADWVAPLLAQFRENALHKLQAGPFPSRDEALAASQRLRSQLHLVPMLVERR
jgi:rare lipoprotein A